MESGCRLPQLIKKDYTLKTAVMQGGLIKVNGRKMPFFCRMAAGGCLMPAQITIFYLHFGEAQ
jgi:hypothetical protein